MFKLDNSMGYYESRNTNIMISGSGNLDWSGCYENFFSNFLLKSLYKLVDLVLIDLEICIYTMYTNGVDILGSCLGFRQSYCSLILNSFEKGICFNSQLSSNTI